MRYGGFPSFCFIVAAAIGAAVLLPFVLPLGDLFLFLGREGGIVVTIYAWRWERDKNSLSGALVVVMAPTLTASEASSVLFRPAFPASHSYIYMYMDSHSSL